MKKLSTNPHSANSQLSLGHYRGELATIETEKISFESKTKHSLANRSHSINSEKYCGIFSVQKRQALLAVDCRNQYLAALAFRRDLHEARTID
jgi:hypothetical protein